jgi:WD40 repeat protein
MRLHQSGRSLIFYSASFALACLILSSPARGDDASFDAAPPPVIVASHRVLLRSPHPPGSPIDESVAFSPDGSAVAAGRVEVKRDRNGKPVSQSTVVSICHPKDGALTARIELADSDGCSVAYSPDGLTLAVGLAREVKLYNTLTWKERYSLTVNQRGCFEGLTFSADGRRLAAATYDSVVVWDLASRDVVVVINARTGFVHGVAFSPDGTMLATASEGPSLNVVVGPSGRARVASRGIGGQLAIWRLDGSPAAPGADYLQPAYDVAFAPDGRSLAASGGDGARLGEVSGTGHPRKIAPAPVFCLAYSRDGRYLAMGTVEISCTEAPGEVRVWDTEAGRDCVVLQAKMSRVRGVAFAPDGRAVVAATREGVFLWELPSPPLEGKATSGAAASEPGSGNSGSSPQAASGKPSKRSTNHAADIFLLVMAGASFLLVASLLMRLRRAAVLSYRAREQCQWLLESWLEREGLSLIRCRMIVLPLAYVITVEDSRGHEYKGWAEVTGKFWSTPEFVPLHVRYFLLWRVAQKTKPTISRERIALWDEWLDRQSEA